MKTDYWKEWANVPITKAPADFRFFWSCFGYSDDHHKNLMADFSKMKFKAVQVLKAFDFDKSMRGTQIKKTTHAIRYDKDTQQYDNIKKQGQLRDISLSGLIDIAEQGRKISPMSADRMRHRISKGKSLTTRQKGVIGRLISGLLKPQHNTHPTQTYSVNQERVEVTIDGFRYSVALRKDSNIALNNTPFPIVEDSIYQNVEKEIKDRIKNTNDIISPAHHDIQPLN